jgi:hypothetical protein
MIAIVQENFFEQIMLMQVQYSITMAGTYSLRVSFSGIVGAQTPIQLMVQSAATDLSRTYGYGTVLRSAAGVTSSLFVQTRDGYGNNALVNPEQYPLGLEEITFELCKSIKDDPTRTCSGGEQEQSISVTLAYGSGPSGSSDTAYGLYTLSYFPFSDGTFVPLVRHNSTVVACLFDTSGLPVAVDPGPTEADTCILQNQIETASSNGRRSMSRILSVSFQQSSKRLATIGKVVMVVNATFKEPDLKNAKHWSFLAPILAAVVGIFFDLCCGFIIPTLRARHQGTENKENSILENNGIGDIDTQNSLKDNNVVGSASSASFCAIESAEATNKEKSKLQVPDSTSLLFQGQAGGLSHEGEKLPLVAVSPVAAKVSSEDNAGVLGAGKDVVVSNLVFITETDQEGLQRCAPHETGDDHLPMTLQMLIPDDEPVWSLTPVPATEGSEMNPWVSLVHGAKP